MHKIQYWTGTHFRSAELWEVGTYIMVPHHTGDMVCSSLAFQKEFLEACEVEKDATEQVELEQHMPRTDHGMAPAPADPWSSDDWEMEDRTDQGTALALADPWPNDPMPNPMDTSAEDQAFEGYLDKLHVNKDMGHHEDTLDGLEF